MWIGITKREMARSIRIFLRSQGYKVLQGEVLKAFSGLSFGRPIRRLFGICHRLNPNNVLRVVHDLEERGVKITPLSGHSVSKHQSPEHVLDQSGPVSAPSLELFASPQTPPIFLMAMRKYFATRNYRFRKCGSCGYLDSSREATVCPNCGLPKTGSNLDAA